MTARRGRKLRFFKTTRRRILSGFVLVVPVAVTVFAARFIYDLVQRWTEPIMERIGRNPFWGDLLEYNINPIPGARVAVTALIVLAGLYTLGMISTTFVIRRLYEGGERLVLRIPLLKDVYTLTKQVIELATNEKKLAFKQMAFFEFPRPGSFALGFVTGESRLDSDPERLYVNILMPLAPIPTQLFLMLVPADQIRIVDLPMDQALKFFMSGGSVTTGQFKTLPYTGPPSGAGGDDPDEMD